MKGKDLIQDLLSGLTVSFAALALGAAFGTMSGRGAFAGMLGAALIPIFTSLLGGTRIQASGPTGPMTAVSALVVAFAYDNYEGSKASAEQFITLVFMLSAILMFLFGLFKLGGFISKVPQVVIIGFMNGIAVLIWFDQIKKMFGVGPKLEPFQGALWLNITLMIATLALIYLLPRLLKMLKVPRMVRIFLPGVLVAIFLMTFITWFFDLDVELVTLGATVSGFEDFWTMCLSYFPGKAMFNMDTFLSAIPYAFQIALLGYLDSLLTALVIDKMTNEKTRFNKELMAQGVANGISAFFQGLPGAQATIRSVLLVKEGAKGRLSGVMIGVFALMGIILFKDYLQLVSSAVFVGVLFKAGADVFDIEFSGHYFKRKWYKSHRRNIQMGFVAYTTIITILFDLNIAVISSTALFYIGKHFWKIEDCEDNLGEMMEAEFQQKYMGGVSHPDDPTDHDFVKKPKE
jgi:sulfate permease, SulP family